MYVNLLISRVCCASNLHLITVEDTWRAQLPMLLMLLLLLLQLLIPDHGGVNIGLRHREGENKENNFLSSIVKFFTLHADVAQQSVGVLETIRCETAATTTAAVAAVAVTVVLRITELISAFAASAAKRRPRLHVLAVFVIRRDRVVVRARAAEAGRDSVVDGGGGEVVILLVVHVVTVLLLLVLLVLVLVWGAEHLDEKGVVRYLPGGVHRQQDGLELATDRLHVADEHENLSEPVCVQRL